MSFYIRLYHGRTDPAKDMDGEWGFQGPLVGPFRSITWTYGSLHLHGDDDFGFLEDKMDGDMIKHDDAWYGDFAILHAWKLNNEDKEKAIPFDIFFKEAKQKSVTDK